MKCFYHQDLDGKCSGYWVRKRYQNCEMVEVDYRYSLQVSTIKADEYIYIVDFSFPVDDMLALYAITKNVVWIDHHATAIEKYENFPYEIQGIRNSDIAGCLLTWAWFNGYAFDRILDDLIAKAPLFTRLIGDYDTWSELYSEDVNFFAYGLSAYETEPHMPIWDELLECGEMRVKQLIDEGKVIERYINQQYRQIADSYAFFVDWEGYRCVCCNHKAYSNLFDSLSGPFDIMITFNYDGTQWVVSLYSKDADIVNVGKIARKYGGGGHACASGFRCRHLPFIRSI